MVRCYSAEALRFSKQINMRDAVILQRGGNKHSNYQRWPVLALKSFLCSVTREALTLFHIYSVLKESGVNINEAITHIS